MDNSYHETEKRSLLGCCWRLLITLVLSAFFTRLTSIYITLPQTIAHLYQLISLPNRGIQLDWLAMTAVMILKCLLPIDDIVDAREALVNVLLCQYW